MPVDPGGISGFATILLDRLPSVIPRMTEEIDAVMFDLGGTLIDLEPSKDVVFHRVLARHGHEVPLAAVTNAVNEAEREYDEESANLDGVHEDRFWEEFDRFVLDRLAFKGDFSRFAKDVSQEFGGIVPKVESWKEHEDARPLIEDLRTRGFRLGVISNATDLARRVMDHLGLTRYFETIVISDDVGVRKPDTRIFLMAAKLARAAPSRCLYLGDKYAVDVVGARRAGMNSILVDRTGIYSDLHCLRIRSLRELRRFL